MTCYRTWDDFLEAQAREPYFAELLDFLARERTAGPVYPPEVQVFRAFELTPLSEVKVVILGQDPYHNENEACGLAFSVPKGVCKPPSLRNIFQELGSDLGWTVFVNNPPNYTGGDLTAWARQGVFLFNRALTVRHKTPGSHLKQWEKFTDAAIEAVIYSSRYMVHFTNWGKPAQEAFERVAYRGGRRVEIIAPGIGLVNNVTFTNSPHPSPLSAKKGFFGSRPFSKANEALRLRHALLPEIPQIDWRLR